MTSAIEFVKKYDIEIAKEAVSNMPKDWDNCYLKESNLEFVKSPPCVSDWVCMNDLKQIVEAWELVEWHGGLKYAKSYYERNSEQYPNATGGWDDLKKAINLVEKCKHD